jgi:phage/plasmid-like protein (TIGR03299 family)
MAANVKSMFSVRQKPWHGLGKIIQDAPNSAEAIRIADLDWTVNQEKAYIEINGKYTEVPGILVNTRSSDNSLLGVVSPDYKVVNNAEAFSFVDEMLAEGVRYETAGCLYNGKVWMLARMPDTEIVGDKTENFLLFTNSHDGKAAVRVACTSVRVVCQNTMNLALRTANRSWSTRHTGDINSKMEEAHRTLKLASSYYKAYAQKANELADTPLSTREFKIFVETLIPSVKDDSSPIVKARIEDQRNLLQAVYQKTADLDNIRGTKWGALQAVSDFVGHKEPARRTNKYMDTRLNSYTTGNPVLDRAYEILSA